MGARILVIEDNPANLDLILYLLQAFGHTAIPASNGVEGLEAARRELPDLIVCDLQLPRMDAYQVAREVRKTPGLENVPLIAVTAYAMVGDRDRVLAAGFSGYIAKPIAPELFIPHIETFLPPQLHSTPPAPAPAPTQAQAHVQAHHTTVLVVDNSFDNADVLRSTLEPFGYRVVAAQSVTEGLELARAHCPDLILSDVYVAGESGYDFIRAVKSDPALSRTPFIFISSTTWLETDLAHGISLGAAAFIRRPIEPEELLIQLKAHLAQ